MLNGDSNKKQLQLPLMPQMSALPEETRRQEEDDIFDQPEQKKSLSFLRELKTTPQTSATDRSSSKATEERFLTPD